MVQGGQTDELRVIDLTVSNVYCINSRDRESGTKGSFTYYFPFRIQDYVGWKVEECNIETFVGGSNNLYVRTGLGGDYNNGNGQIIGATCMLKAVLPSKAGDVPWGYTLAGDRNFMLWYEGGNTHALDRMFVVVLDDSGAQYDPPSDWFMTLRMYYKKTN